MSTGDQFMSEYKKLSNPSSAYYKQGYQGLLDVLNASAPTVNTLAGTSMMHGGSYKGSQITANRIRQGIETKNAGTARKGFLDMYMSGQGLAQQALRGAQQAYEYEDSKPSFWEEAGGFALGGLTQAIMPGVGGFLGGAITSLFSSPNKGQTQGGQTGAGWQASNNAGANNSLPVGYKNTPVYKPFNY